MGDAVNIKIVMENDNTELFLKATDQQLTRAMETIGIKAEAHAKAKCPVDTGRLRNSITHSFSGAGERTKNYQQTFEKGSHGKKALAMKDRVHYKYKHDMGGSIEHKIVYVGTNVEYGKYVEMGTSRMSPRPFIKPAIADHLDEYQSIIENELRK